MNKILKKFRNKKFEITDEQYDEMRSLLNVPMFDRDNIAIFILTELSICHRVKRHFWRSIFHNDFYLVHTYLTKFQIKYYNLNAEDIYTLSEPNEWFLSFFYPDKSMMKKSFTRSRERYEDIMKQFKEIKKEFPGIVFE